MSLYSKQIVYCMNCGTQHETSFGSWGGKVCSYECSDELHWKKTLSVMGHEYKPMPESVKFNKEFYKDQPKK